MPAATACVVRDATDADLDAIHAIYAHHVRHSVASFEEIPPDVDELRALGDGARTHPASPAPDASR